MHLPANINFDKTVLPKKIKLLTIIIVGSVVLYLVAFSIISFLNRFHNGAPFQIKPLTFTQTPSGKDKLHNFVWEYPLKTLIAVPYNVHFHLEFKSNKSLTDDILKPVVLTASDSYSGAVLYEERIYPHGDEVVTRDYYWSINQNWKGLYIQLFSLNEKNLLKIENAILGWDISLNSSLISIVFNEVLLNSKWLLIYLIVSIIILRLIFFRYYPVLAYKKVKIDFPNPIPWIICVLAVAFQFHLITISAYPLYSHDYEITLRAISWLQKGSFSNFVTEIGYAEHFAPPPVPQFLLAQLIWLLGTKWGYFTILALRIFVIWATWDITKRIYKNAVAAYAAMLFICILPFNLYFSPLMNISGYDKMYYFDFGKILSVMLLYSSFSFGLRMISEFRMWLFRLWVSLFWVCGILSVLSRWEVLATYSFLCLLLFGLILSSRRKRFLLNYMFISCTLGILSGSVVLYYLRNITDVGGMPSNTISETIKLIYLYFTTEHVYNNCIMIIVPLFFRILMVRFILKNVLLEAALLCCFVSVAYGLSKHSFVYSRLIYAFPLQAIIAGIGIISLYQFLFQTWMLVKVSLPLRSTREFQHKKG